MHSQSLLSQEEADADLVHVLLSSLASSSADLGWYVDGAINPAAIAVPVT